LPGLLAPKSLYRRLSRSSCSKAVIDHDHGAAADIQGRAIPAVRPLPPLQLCRLACDSRLHRQLRDAQVRHEPPVEQRCAGRDGTHGKFLGSGDTQLAHNEYIEIASERGSDLVPDDHPASRKPENERMLHPVTLQF
jgi:hypothetical protein